MLNIWTRHYQLMDSMPTPKNINSMRQNPNAHINSIWSAGTHFKNLPLRLSILLLLILCAGLLYAAPRLLLSGSIIFCSGVILTNSALRLAAVINASPKTMHSGLAWLNRRSTKLKPANMPSYPALKSAPPSSLNPPLSAPPDGWPHYTVLVPLHHEAHMVKPLMQALSQIDYPIERLQILMITEGADQATVNAVNANLKAPFHNIVVPFSMPQTKPKALNIAMKYARGDIITIYDAEDIPHPTQLKSAVRAFMADINLGAVQAPLDYFNANQNWLTRQFALEYGALFHIWNPFLDKLNLPFPLGGTSNHIRRDALRQVDLWDSYNVTEDADLTFRLSAYGWKIGTILPPTQEEAVCRFQNWQHQRVRWLKGYIQTWQVHMRTARGYGLPRMISLQITLGFTLLSAFLHVPAVIIMSALYGGIFIGLFEYQLDNVYLYIMAIGYGSALLCGAFGAICARQPKLLFSVLAMPFYWLCLFWPAVKAIRQLLTAPFYWNKTHHGDAIITQGFDDQGSIQNFIPQTSFDLDVSPPNSHIPIHDTSR